MASNTLLPTEVSEFLSNSQFAWLGQRALDCIGLHQLMNFVLVICCDYGLDTSMISNSTGAQVVSLERETGIRELWSNFSLDRLWEGNTLSILSEAFTVLQRPLNVLAYCSTDGIERLAGSSDGRIRVLAARAFLKQFFDSKITLRAVLPALGIEPVPGHVARLAQIRFREVQRSYGLPLVIQFPVGAAGRRTFILYEETELKDLQETNDRTTDVIIMKYVKGPAPNVNAVVLDDEILVAYPSVQLIGTAECTCWPAGYCGNDFCSTDDLPAPAVKDIQDQATRIGRWIRQHGFRGMYGVDFVVDGSTVYPVEVNPRFQGSTGILTQLEMMSGHLPLTLAHVLQFMENGRSILSGHSRFEWTQPHPIAGAQMILHSKEADYQAVGQLLQPGIYKLSRGEPRYCRPGTALADCTTKDEFVITCAVPVLNTRVEPGAPLLKIQTQSSVLDLSKGTLRPWASLVCNWAYRALQLHA